MKKIISGAVAASMLVATVAIPALGQPRDAGFKIRGNIARPSSPSRTYSQPSYQRMIVPQPSAVARAPMADDAYRTFAYEPMDFGPGDTVVVVGERANMMLGRQALATVPRGENLRVLRIEGPWVGTVYERDGRQVGGWVWYDQVAAAGAEQ